MFDDDVDSSGKHKTILFIKFNSINMLIYYILKSCLSSITVLRIAPVLPKGSPYRLDIVVIAET